MIKAVFFDVGGVLARDDSEGIIKRQARVLRVSRRRMEAAARPHRVLIGKGLISRRAYLRKLCAALRRPLIGDRELKIIFPKRVHRYVRNWNTARRLRRAGYIVGVITNDVPPHRFLPKTPLHYPPFHPIIRSYVVHARKPEREIFEIAVRRAGIRFSEAIFLDDRPENVAAAARLGMKAFLYRNPAQLVRSLRRFGVRI